jgi:hypothetical protein
VGSDQPVSPSGPPTAGAQQPPIRRVQQFVVAVRDADEQAVEALILRLSQSRRWLAPLALLVSAFALLFSGLKLLILNWRLTLVQLLPAMWIWLATYDLRAHVLHGRTVSVLRGPILIPLIAIVAAITAGCFFLNAVFAFAVADRGVPKIRPAVAQARAHLRPILLSGTVVGIALGLAAFVVTRAGRPWFALSLGIVIGVMMLCYVAVPSWILGVKPKQSLREKLTTSAVGGVLGMMVVAPPYMLSRLGILMLGSKWLFVPGLVFVSVGAALAAGATSAVKAVKMSAKLVERDTDQRPASRV